MLRGSPARGRAASPLPGVSLPINSLPGSWATPLPGNSTEVLLDRGTTYLGGIYSPGSLESPLQRLMHLWQV